MFSGIGWTEVLIVLGIVLLLFGGTKLPELARGSGRALRIFKTEVKALDDDEKSENAESATRKVDSTDETPRQTEQG